MCPLKPWFDFVNKIKNGSEKVFDCCLGHDETHMLDDVVTKTCYNMMFVLEVERLTGCERKT